MLIKVNDCVCVGNLNEILKSYYGIAKNINMYIYTYCSIDKWIYEHRKDFKRANINNSLIKHNLETNHNFNFKDSKMLVYIHKKL